MISTLAIFVNYFNIYGLYIFLPYDLNITSRINSSLHSLIALRGSYLFLTGLSHNDYQIYIDYTSTYLIIDFLLIISHDCFKTKRYIMLFHHINFFMYCILSRYWPYYFARAIFTEISTIPLNISYYILHYKKSGLTFFGILTWLCFLIFRVLNITQLFYTMYLDEIYLPIFLGSLGALLNYYWFYILSLKLLTKI